MLRSEVRNVDWKQKANENLNRDIQNYLKDTSKILLKRTIIVRERVHDE